jgi:hypothetical protein
MEQTTSSLTPQTGAGTWRALSRVFLGFIVLFAAVWIIRLIMGVGPNLFMRSIGASENFRAYIGSTLNYGVGIVSYIILTAVTLRKILNIDPRHILFPIQKNWWKDLLFGFVLVALILGSFFIIELRLGWLVIDSWNWQTLPLDEFLRVAWVGLLINVGVAIGEESLFRGYLLTGLKTTLGKWQSILLMMIVFGLFHLPAYSESGGMRAWTLTLAILLATLFGGLFGLIYLRTGSLWLSVSLHFAWNFIENDVLNITAVSSNPNLIGALTQLQSPLTATGFGFGNVMVLETAMFALIAVGVWLYLKWMYQNP